MKTENQANSQGYMVLYHSTQPGLYAQSYINTQLQKLALELKGKKIDTETLLMRDLNKPRSYQEEESKRQKFLKYATIHDDITDQEFLFRLIQLLRVILQALGNLHCNIFYRRKI